MTAPNLGNLKGPASYVEYELTCLKDTLQSMSQIQQKPGQIPVYKTSSDTLAGTFIQKVNEQGQSAIGTPEDREEPSFISNVVKQAKEIVNNATDVAATALGFTREKEVSDPTTALHDINDFFDQTLTHLEERQNRLKPAQLERCKEQLGEIAQLANRAQEGVSKMGGQGNTEFQKESSRFKSLCEDVEKMMPKKEVANREQTVNVAKKILPNTAALDILRSKFKPKEPGIEDDLKNRSKQAIEYFEALNDAIHRISIDEAINENFEIITIKEGTNKIIKLDEERLAKINKILDRRGLTAPDGLKLKVGDNIIVSMRNGVNAVEFIPKDFS